MMNLRGTCAVRAAATLVGTALLAGCGDTSPAGAASPTAASPTAASPTATLPLQAGFYVASDTPCGEASTATLTLFRGNGLSGARDTCEFATVEQTGPRTWLVTERCAEFGNPGSEHTELVTWTSKDDRSFYREAESGWDHDARFCPQTELPEPWRDNDLSDL